jgi:hypothetical protein
MPFLRDLVWKEMKEFERRFNLDLRVDEIVLDRRRTRSGEFILYEPGRAGGRIHLPADVRGRQLREFLYHELGHALRAAYCIPTPMTRHFESYSAVGLNKANLLRKLAEDQRYEGFVSAYAMTNKEEDFCDTLSAWVMNGFRQAGRYEFDGDRFSLSQDPIILKKLRAVERILKYCGEIDLG